jgi:hypothetical protein
MTRGGHGKGFWNGLKERGKETKGFVNGKRRKDAGWALIKIRRG